MIGPPHHPFPPPRVTLYLIFCFLFSVTAEPSWCVVACCQDCAFKPEEFHPERQRVDASVTGMKSFRKVGKEKGKKLQLTTNTPHLSPHAAGVAEGKQTNKKKVTRVSTQARAGTNDEASVLMWHVAATPMLLDSTRPSCSQLLCLARQHSTLRGRHARHTDRPLRRTKTTMVCALAHTHTHKKITLAQPVSLCGHQHDWLQCVLEDH